MNQGLGQPDDPRQREQQDARDHRPEQTEATGLRLLWGSFPDRIEMKMMLSTPSTISRNVSVASATQICGSVSQSISNLCPALKGELAV